MLRLFVDVKAVIDWLTGLTSVPQQSRTPGNSGEVDLRRHGDCCDSGSIASDHRSQHHIIELPISIKRRGVARRLVIEGTTHPAARLDRPLINMIARANAYLEALTDGSNAGRQDVAERFGVHPEDVSRMLPLAFLSPQIVTNILTGNQPADLSVKNLARAIELAVDWADQATAICS